MGNGLMTTDTDKIFTALGVLKADMSNLGERFDKLEDRTTDEQRKVHDIVVATSEAVRNVVAMQTNLQRLVDEMKPLTDDYREKRAEARGAARLAGWLYTGAAAAGGSIVLGANWLIEKLASRPHIPIIIILVSLVAIGKALGQDVGHRHHPVADMPLHEKFYSTWYMPSDRTKSCCNKMDCAPARATYDAKTRRWTAWSKIKGDWIVIPESAIERERDDIPSGPHLCENRSGVLCFGVGNGT